MADTPELIIKTRLDDSGAKEGAKKLENDFSALGKKLAGALGAALSVGSIYVALRESVQEALAAEKAVTQFNSALQASGNYTKAASDSFQAYAGELQKLTGIQDDLIVQNAALLVSVGKLSGDGLERATKAALDLANGMQIDVSTAFDVMAKAANGNVMALSRYGLEARKGASDSEKFAAALAFVEQRFGGSSERAMQTFSGALTAFRNAVGNLFEEIGKLITQSPKLRAAMIVAAELIQGVAESIAKIGEGANPIDSLIEQFFKLGQIVINWVLKPLELIANFFATTWMTIVSSFLTGLGLVAPLLDKVMGTNFAEGLQKNAEIWRQATLNMAADAYTFDTSTSQALSNGLTTVETKVKSLAASFTNDLKPAIAQTVTETTSMWGSFVEGFKEFNADMNASMKQLGAQVKNTFSGGFSNAFAAMGRAMVQGQDMFGEFGKAILQMLGNVAMQMGQFFIATGIGFLFLDPGRGAGMIAAGIGLSLLGGILSALGGGGASVSTPAAGANGVVTGSQDVNVTGSSDFATDEERAAPQTGVTVNVMGSVLDRRQTGLEIVNIINESFDTDGVVLRAASGVV